MLKQAALKIAGTLEELGLPYAFIGGFALAFWGEPRLRLDGVPVDIAFAMPGYEEEALRRAVRVPLAGGQVRVLSPEDLIIHKCVAGHPRDLEDVKGILLRQRELDLDYIRRWLREFEGLVQGSPLKEFEKILGEIS